MDRVSTAVSNTDAVAADYNTFQDRALGIAQLVGARWGGGLMRVTQTQVTLNRVAFFPAGLQYVRSGTPAALSLGTLTADAWYYAYLYDNAGTLTLEVSTTVPDASLLYKSGDPTRVYVGPVLMDSTTNAVPAVKVGNRYLWRPSGQSGANFNLGGPSGAGGTSITTVSLVDGVGAVNMVPPHAQVIEVRIDVNNTSGTPQTLNIFTESDTNVKQVLQAPPGHTTLGPIAIDIGTTQVLKMQNSNSSMTTNVYAHGFFE